MSKNKVIRFGQFFLLLLACGMLGCKSSQRIAKPNKQIQTEKLISQVLQQQPSFQMAQASKISATLMYGERKTSVSGSINMITDSAMVLSIQPMLGIELFRMELHRQKIVIVDKMNRRYVEMEYAQIAEQTGIPVDFETLQAMCSNRLFAVGNANYFAQPHAQCELEEREDGHRNITFLEKGILHSFVISDATGTIDEVRLSQSEKTDALEVSYSNYRIANDVAFPNSITISVKAEKYNVQCVFDMLRLTFNEKANVSAADLKRYKQVGIEELLNK